MIWLAALAAVVIAICLAWHIRSLVAAWTVCQAWNWMILALLALCLCSILSSPMLQTSDAVSSVAALFASTMLLTPLVTTLGARRPGIGPWHWFVVLPMVVVLMWPAVSQLSGSHWQASFELSVPATMGIWIVLFMSAGTLLGTGSTSFALVYSCGIVLLLTAATGGGPPAAAFGSIFILAAIGIARRNIRVRLQQIRSAESTLEKTRAVWKLFSSLYGFAWTRRIQDRVNQFAPREQWNVRLASTGFICADGSTPADSELEKPCEIFIWVLSRFAREDCLRDMLKCQNLPDPQNPIVSPN